MLLQGGSVSAQSITAPTSLFNEIEGYGNVSGAISQAIVIAKGGTLNVSGTTTGAGIMEVYGGATLDLAQPTDAYVAFEGSGATLKLDAPAQFSGSINNTVVGDTLDLGGITANSATYNGTTLTAVSYTHLTPPTKA